MYDLLIPEVIRSFAEPHETERGFLERVRQADVRLTAGFRSQEPISPDRYTDASLRAAYLLRYLGHYSLQLGDLLVDLEGTPAGAVLARSDLRLVALCGGPCPEAIALASLHHQAGGQCLQVDVLDRHARSWADCWPITTAIAHAYPQHPQVRIAGLSIDLTDAQVSPRERLRLARADVFTAMNCLNELISLGEQRLRRGLEARLDQLPAGTLILACDQANYRSCERGLGLLHGLLRQRQASLLITDLDPGAPHCSENRLGVPERIAWIYRAADKNQFRVFTKQLRLTALLT